MGTWGKCIQRSLSSTCLQQGNFIKKRKSTLCIISQEKDYQNVYKAFCQVKLTYVQYFPLAHQCPLTTHCATHTSLSLPSQCVCIYPSGQGNVSVLLCIFFYHLTFIYNTVMLASPVYKLDTGPPRLWPF